MISDMIRRMKEAGATLEVIMIAVEAVEALERAEAERKAKRAEQKRKERAAKDDVARQSSDNEATVAATSPQVSPPKRYNQPPSSSPSSGSSLRSDPAARRATRLSADWQPSDTDREFARSRGLTDRQIEAEAEKIRNWSASASNGACLNWSARWRNWILKSIEHGTGPPQRQQRGPTMAEMARMDEPGFTFDDPRPDPRDSPTRTADAPDQSARGFVGRLSFADREKLGGEVVDL